MFQSKQQSLHRIAVGIVAFSISAFTLVGCDDRDVAIGLGGAAIGAGAAIIINCTIRAIINRIAISCFTKLPDQFWAGYAH